MEYKCLNKQIYSNDRYSLVPIRFEDRYLIMQWRNEQIYHLRQNKSLTKEDQDAYFENVVAKLFDQEQPGQILFSFLEDGNSIGYGGLVHINWTDRHAEISFIMNTALEKDRFQEIWAAYLGLIEQVAFREMNLHKIFTYAFDLRPHLYPVLESCGFKEEARLKEHCYFGGQHLDVVYHSKMNRIIRFRKPTKEDMLLYFNWNNDPYVRVNSYQLEPTPLENHQNWFYDKIVDENCFMLIFENHLGTPIGQVRIQKQNETTAIIGISVDANHRGKGYASKMIEIASREFFTQHPEICISAYIKIENEASKKAFEKAGYELDEVLEYLRIPSYHYTKRICK